MSICEGFFGSSSSYLSEVLLTRALVQRDLGNLRDAQVSFDRVIAIVGDTSRPGGTARLANVLREYVVLLKKQGRADAVAETEARIRLLESKREQR